VFQEATDADLMFNLTTFFDEQEQQEMENQMADEQPEM